MRFITHKLNYNKIFATENVQVLKTRKTIVEKSQMVEYKRL